MGASLDCKDSFLWKYRNYLRRIARRRLGSRLRGKVDESDLIQEAILQAYLNRNQFRGTSEAQRRGWLRTILENKIISALRRFSRRRRDSGREISLESRSCELAERGFAGDATTASVSRQVDHDEELRRLAVALAALPDDQRRAVEMHHLEGLSFAEIAARLGRSRTSVAGLVFRGVSALRLRLVDSDTGDRDE
jgi:RNA polymerase sigma-70 factor (ECF subfamily)